MDNSASSYLVFGNVAQTGQVSILVLDFGIKIWYRINMNKKHLKTWDKLWHDPVLSGIIWPDIEAMLMAIAKISEGNGSRVRIKLNGVRAVFHRPHPENTTDKGAVKSMRKFLQSAGITKEVLKNDEV